MKTGSPTPSRFTNPRTFAETEEGRRFRAAAVVPTRERLDLLKQCLTALTNQRWNHRWFEVIVVDDDPQESARTLVEWWALKYRKTGPAIRYLPARGEGPAAARNIGWRSAQADVIAFTDDDCLPQSDWLASGVLAVEASGSAVAGRTVVPTGDHPTDYELNARLLEEAPFVTANCFIHRDHLEQVGGFDENFKAAWREDTDLAFSLERANIPVAKVANAEVVHPVRSARWGEAFASSARAGSTRCCIRSIPSCTDSAFRSIHPGVTTSSSCRHPWLSSWLFSIQRQQVGPLMRR